MMDILDFIDASPSPYHTVRTMRRHLDKAGFTYLPAEKEWRLTPGALYYTQRAGKSLVAWRQGFAPLSEAGFRIMAAHTDSPCLKIKPNPMINSGQTHLVSIDVYGSPLLYTWLDRDLKLAGVVHVNEGGPYQIRSHVVELGHVQLRAPSLAVHLNRGLKTDGLKINPQTELNLFLGQDNSTELSLRRILAEQLNVAENHIHGYDLSAADTQPSARIGAATEFLSAPRLDNLFSCYCLMQALLSESGEQAHTRLGVWFDAEEIGSETVAGAGSNFLDATLLRIMLASGQESFADFHRAKAASVMISSDMAHAEHPAFKDRTDEYHVPKLNGGLAIKSAAAGRYGDSTELAAWFASACLERGLSLQRFSYRCDHGGGSSVGPLISSNTGIKTIDVGAPMISMHSVRELAGSHDVDQCISALTVFLVAPVSILEI